MPGLGSLDHATRQAVESSFLAAIPEAALDQLLSDVIRLDIPAGGIPYRQSDLPRAGLVISGLVRVFMASPEGRQVTVRYARAGEMLGIPTLVGGPVPVSVQAITDVAILAFNTVTIESIAKKNAAVAWALAEETSRRLHAVLEELAVNTFGSVRERTARHLLDMASERQRPSGRILVAPATQQQIADAVGSVREVIARALHQLSAEGLVRTMPEGIEIMDPIGLLAVSRQRTV